MRVRFVQRESHSVRRAAFFYLLFVHTYKLLLSLLCLYFSVPTFWFPFSVFLWVFQIPKLKILLITIYDVPYKLIFLRL